MPTFVFPCRGLVNELEGEDVTLWELGAIKQVDLHTESADSDPLPREYQGFTDAKLCYLQI